MPALVSVTVEPPSATIDDDDSLQLVAYAHFDNATSRALTYRETNWTSSDPDICTVANFQTLSGLCIGQNPGTVTITVAATPQGHDETGTGTATATLTLVEAVPSTIPEGRFLLGFASRVLGVNTVWTVIDDHPNLVTSYSIDRGRVYELDQTDAGTATVDIQDPNGILDPTNPDGPYYGQIRPLLHALICRRDPVTGAWRQRYRGFVEDFAYDVHPSQQTSQLTITLVDLFEICASVELQPGQNGTEGPWTGRVHYDTKRVDQRIVEIFNEIGLPKRRRVILQGGVNVKATNYSGGETAMSAIQEAADAEFPAVTGIVCDRKGRLCFRGRHARFDPTVVAADAGAAAWDYHEWAVGDAAAIAADPVSGDPADGIAQIRGIDFTRGLSKIINTAVALPVGAPDDQVEQQTVIDGASISQYGKRSWSATDLITKQGDITLAHPTNPVTETHRFAEFYVSNYAEARDRINQVTVRSLHPSDPRAADTWELLCKIDIGDTVRVHVSTPAGDGFGGEPYFVEGVHEEVRPLTPDYDDVTLTLDLSPRAYYNINPWETPLTADDDPDPTKRYHRGGKPKTKTHGGDHGFGGTDPVPTDYENVGTDAGDGEDISAWSEATLINGWEGAAFYRRHAGVTELAGHIANGSSDSVAFVLPSDARPGNDVSFITDLLVDAVFNAARVTVSSITGEVTITYPMT